MWTSTPVVLSHNKWFITTECPYKAASVETHMYNVNLSKNVPDWHCKSVVEKGSKQNLLIPRNASIRTETSEAVNFRWTS